MQAAIGCLIGLAFGVSVSAESLLEGQVRLDSGQPAVGVQVRLFDLTDLRRFVGTTTDETGHFALPPRERIQPVEQALAWTMKEVSW